MTRPRRRKRPSLLEDLSNEILLFKDFTTVLEMARDKLKTVLAQLRELYDGRFDTFWGTGLELHWEGRLGFLAGVTPVIDKHHKVMAVLGPRFLQLRLRQPDRREAGLRAAQNLERDDAKIRKDLRASVAQFVTRLPADAPTISEAHLSTLVDIAELVTRARSAVERDPRDRDVVFTPTPEMPPRFVRQLVSLAHGIALVSGHGQVGDDDVARVARVGVDGIPPPRRACLEILAGKAKWTPVADVAEHLRCSHTHARRTLEDLEVLDLVQRNSAGVGVADCWLLHKERSSVVVRWLGKSHPRQHTSASGLSARARIVLSALAAFPGGQARLGDIRAKAGVPVRTCQRVLSGLVRDGHAEKPGERGVYRITDLGRARLSRPTQPPSGNSPARAGSAAGTVSSSEPPDPAPAATDERERVVL